MPFWQTDIVENVGNIFEKKEEQDETQGEEEEEIQDIVNTIEYLEEEGLNELTSLYKLLLGLEDVDDDVVIILNLSEIDYGNKIEQIKNESKDEFTSKLLTYEFLFKYISNPQQELFLLDRIQKLDENQFIDFILIPLFTTMGFKNVMSSASWSNRKLFTKDDSFGRNIYYGGQVKAVSIHTNSQITKGNVQQISNQLDFALNCKLIDEIDNEVKSIDTIMLITSQEINDNARLFLHNKYPKRTLILLNGKKIVELLVKYNLERKIFQNIK